MVSVGRSEIKCREIRVSMKKYQSSKKDAGLVD
jgi:hypothetical protein